MHDGHRLSLRAKDMELEATSRAPEAAPKARSPLLQNRKCRTPERSPSPPRAPKRAAWRISTRGGGCAALNPAQGSEYETVTAALVGDTAPEGRVLVAEQSIRAQLLEARRDPGWSGVSWAGISGPRGDPVSGPPPYICSLRWAVWTAVWGCRKGPL